MQIFYITTAKCTLTPVLVVGFHPLPPGLHENFKTYLKVNSDQITTKLLHQIVLLYCWKFVLYFTKDLRYKGPKQSKFIYITWDRNLYKKIKRTFKNLHRHWRTDWGIRSHWRISLKINLILTLCWQFRCMSAYWPHNNGQSITLAFNILSSGGTIRISASSPQFVVKQGRESTLYVGSLFYQNLNNKCSLYLCLAVKIVPEFNLGRLIIALI